MYLTDVHTHTAFSADGKAHIIDMIAAAKQKRLTLYGVSEHFDYDYKAEGILVHGKTVAQIDETAYFSSARALQKRINDNFFRLLVGAECGYSDHPQAIAEYQAMIARYQPDYVINSVHSIDGVDVYFCEFFENKKKHAAYERYLQRVRESLDAPYRYDIVGHIGYVSRNAPYEDKKLRYAEFATLYDDILSTIIAKEKILEVNSSAHGTGGEHLPDADILRRYFELGGRLVSYGSDAHAPDRILDKWEHVVAVLKEIGFTYITVPCQGQYVQIPLEE